eukprot:snap_masked-scaffold_78-processed-gene-0.51-mRNA-1 protein AED:1.00 eAED:1.00 QI:0/0/0/0/1/1/2/0/64
MDQGMQGNCNVTESYGLSQHKELRDIMQCRLSGLEQRAPNGLIIFPLNKSGTRNLFAYKHSKKY